MGTSWLTIVCLTISCFVCYGNILDKVSYHELIKATDMILTNRIRRDVESTKANSKTMEFGAMGMKFVCHLKPRTDFYAPNFKLKVYGSDGIPHEVKFLTDDKIFIGNCEGDPESRIRGIFIKDVFEGKFLYKGEWFGIEDASRHIPSIPSADHMVVYRVSDMKTHQDGSNNTTNSGKFCGNDGIDLNHGHPKPQSQTLKTVVDEVVPEHLGRYKRAVIPSKETCKILAVVDYKYFKNIGNSDVYDTAIHVSGVMDRVDDIFRRTVWNVNGAPYSGMGFELAEMRVFEDYTSGFNGAIGAWDAQKLLQTFSTDLSFKDFCVAHLFTHQSFEGNILGMAYIASERTTDIGGICSPQSYIASLNSQASENTGFTTTRNAYGTNVLLQQSDLVTAHELGHNWGSNHDPSSGSCAPSDIFGDGKYLMYAISVGGYDSNNDEFSSCSRNEIGRVIAAKGNSCFTRKSSDESLICGNAVIDDGEECDAGILGRLDLDKCCTQQCTFTSGSSCSPVNHECCSNCQTAGNGQVCRSDNDLGCLKSASCDGSSLSCPASLPKDENTTCLDEGMCRSGECASFCAARGLESCACSNFDDSCKRCCKTAGGACQPFDDNSYLPNGRPCVAGYCENRVCEPSSVSTVQRLFNILDSLSVNSVLRFFERNMVGVVIVFTLIVWIPACIIISHCDRKKRNKLGRSEEIEIRRDRELIFDQDGRQAGVAHPRAAQNGPTSPRYRTLNFTDLGGFGSGSEAAGSEA